MDQTWSKTGFYQLNQSHLFRNQNPIDYLLTITTFYQLNQTIFRFYQKEIWTPITLTKYVVTDKDVIIGRRGEEGKVMPMAWCSVMLLTKLLPSSTCRRGEERLGARWCYWRRCCRAEHVEEERRSMLLSDAANKAAVKLHTLERRGGCCCSVMPPTKPLSISTHQRWEVLVIVPTYTRVTLVRCNPQV